jgi:RHS repeat-associated protein
LIVLFASALFAAAAEDGVDLDNRLSSVTSVPPPGGGNPAVEPIISDLNGNLVCDNVYWYQYDAFNRLVQVNQVGTLAFAADGTVLSGTPGPWLMHCVYDGLGRMVATERPWPGLPQNEERLIRYLYDGVRRIQEVIRDPISSTGPLGSAGVIGGGGYTTRTDREYVHSPHYVDELLFQVDRTGAVAWVLQDANYNVVGLVGGSGNVLQQWQYDPYGEPVAFDTPGTYAHNRVGHQGLFFDRLDGTLNDPPLALRGKGTYHTHNRRYDPRLGRWIEADPNGTGQTVLSAVTYMGRNLAPQYPAFDFQAVNGDGLSRYAFVGASPTMRTDPAGLFGIMGILMTGLDMAGMAAGAVDDARQAYSMTDAVEDFLDAVAVQQLFDVEWALDMESDDDWYSGSAAAAQARSADEADGFAMAAMWTDWGAGRAAHGGAWHDAMSRAWAEYYRIKYGPQNVRFNQALVDANGKTVSRLRPDIQAYDARKGKWHVVEIEDSNVRGKEGNRARRAAIADALGVPESDVSYSAIGRGDPIPGPVQRMMRTRPWSRR